MRERELLKLVRKDAHYRGILKMDVVSLCEYVSKKYQAELTLAQGNILLSHLKESAKPEKIKSVNYTKRPRVNRDRL